MEYRPLGNNGLEVSAIGLGTEYLIDLPQEHVVKVIREAIAQGVNYFDLFYAQPEFRDNMGAAFEGHRERALLGAHLGAIWEGGQSGRSRDLQVCERFFLDFLDRYKTDYVDLLLLHNCDGQDDYDELTGPEGPLGLARRLKQEGKARAIGFSGHTVATAFQAVENPDIDVLMYSINLAGNAVPGRRELLNACVRNGVGLVAMKPYAGGRLFLKQRKIAMEFTKVGGPAKELKKSTEVTPVQCLAYVLSQAGVSTVVPGCKDLPQLADALAYSGATAEQKDYSAALADFREYVTGECVFCNHCLPCPAEIDIGQTIRLLETAQGSPTPELQAAYDALPAKASDCLECGDCTERCPFGVNAMGGVAQAAQLYD